MNKSWLNWIWVPVFVALMLMLSRCGQKDSGPASGTFSHVYTVTLKTACIECHVPTGAATVSNGVTLDFSTQAKAYSTLTGSVVTGQTSSGICANVKIVTASDLAKSYLAAVLFSDYNISNFAGKTGCSPDTTHLSRENLSAAEKTSITTWITNGAKND